MIQRLTWLNLTDSSAVLWIKAFQLYGGFFRRTTQTGFFLKGAVRIIKPQLGFYKGFNIKKIKKGAVRRVLVVRTAYKKTLFPLTFVFSKNSATLIKKKNLFLSKHILGPTSRLVRNKRLQKLFLYLI